MKLISIITIIVVLSKVSLGRHLSKRMKSPKASAKLKFSHFKLSIENAGFILGHKIGSGGFGVVYEVTKDSISYAAKGVFFRGQMESEIWNHDKSMLTKEAEQMKEIKDLLFVMPLCDSFSIKDNHEEIGLIFIMPMAEKEDFYDIMHLFYAKDSEINKENLILFLLAMTEAVEQIHSNGIIHGDIKPQNFVLYKTKYLGKEISTPLLIDFGTASSETGMFDVEYITNSPMMTAPDVKDGMYLKSFKNDIYSLGMVMGVFVAEWMSTVYANIGENDDFAALRKKCMSLSPKCFTYLSLFAKELKVDSNFQELFEFIVAKMLCKQEKRADINEVKEKMIVFANAIGNGKQNAINFKNMVKASIKAKLSCSGKLF